MKAARHAAAGARSRRLDPVGLTTRHVLLPAYAAVTSSSLMHHRRCFQRSQFCSADEIRRGQWSAVQEMLRHAAANSSFYRRRFAELGVAPGDIRSFDDYARLPLLTKDDLRAHAGELLCDGHDERRLERKRTGGSTGVPVHLFQDKEVADAKLALRLRHDEWAGFKVGTRKAALWGDVQPRRGLRRKLTGALYERTIFLDTLKMDERSMLEFADRIRRTRTRLLFGHGHSLYTFARFLLDRGVRDLRLDGIISSAEMLPPEERRVVEELFGDIVFDRYGCEEVGLVASECAERDGMHVAAEGIYLEVLGGCEREPGRVVITDLVNRVTPLLRYEIGDLATMKHGSCRCGRGLPRIGRVTGRTSDVLYTPDGKQISGISLLDTVTIHIPGFRQVQVVQEAIDRLEFFVVRDGNCCEQSLRLLAQAVERYFGPRMRHEVVFVDRLTLTGRGKYQFSICKLKRSAHLAA